METASRLWLEVTMAGMALALPATAIAEIVPLPRLWRPPGAPPVVFGVMDLRVQAVAVVRLDRLLGLDNDGRLGPFSPVVVLKGTAPWGVAVERAVGVHRIEAGQVAPAPADSSFNGCVEVVVPGRMPPLLLLRPERLLLVREKRALEAFAEMARERAGEWAPC